MNIKREVRSKLRDMLWQFDSSIILTFHHLQNSPLIPRSSCMVDTGLFYNIIKGYKDYIALPELVNNKTLIKRGGGKIALTFDDGLEDIYTIGYPFLSIQGIPFTLFIVYDFLDSPGYLTKKQLLEMSKDPLVTIGVHGMNHIILTKASYEEKRIEIKESKIKIEELIGKGLNYFAYSHGQFDCECIEIVKNVGYKAAFTIQYRPYNIVTCFRKMQLPRLNITQDNIELNNTMLKRIYRK